MSETPGLFAISPGRGDLEELRRCLPAWAAGGLRRFLLREKQASAAERRAWALDLVPRCRELGLEAWISEDEQLVRTCGATGVHLSERCVTVPEDLPYGLSLHAHSRRSPAALAGAHHVFLGPVFDTPSKTGILEPIGPRTFLERSRGIRAPVYALGGITVGRLRTLAGEGIRRVAGIRLFFGRDPRGAVERALEQLAEDERCR